MPPARGGGWLRSLSLSWRQAPPVPPSHSPLGGCCLCSQRPKTGRAQYFPAGVQVTEMLGGAVGCATPCWAGEAGEEASPLCMCARPVLEADGGASPDPRPSQNDFMVG